ncbi:MAG: hypothetical protein ACLP9L_40410 [Thermoguttaceae bacterium]
MADNAQKRKYKIVPAWRRKAIAVHRLFLTDVFPDESSYLDSRWGSWEQRIQQGHTREEKLIERIYDRRKKRPSPDPTYDPDEWAGEDYMETCLLTNAMYAALAVSIWSEMEHFLKDVVSLCYQALEKRKTALQKTQKFCEDTLAGMQPKATLGSCIKALKEIDAGIPYKFDEIRKTLKNEVHVTVDQCAEYTTINAVRILNNSFKHNKGCYQLEDRESHDRIDEALLKKWSILNERSEIDYSKLPMKELVIACNGFCADLLVRVETYLESKLGATK